MASVAKNLKDREGSADFADLLNQSMGKGKRIEGNVIVGRVVNMTSDFAIIDVGLKSEGRVPLREFSMPGQPPEVKIGDKVEVFIERMENRDGETAISREKARREEVWVELEKASQKAERVTGIIFGRVKGGFTVDLGGAVAFLPGSQVDIRPVRDVSPLMGTPQPFQILKMDRSAVATSLSRAAPFSRKAVRKFVPKSWAPSRKVKFSQAWSRTSPITVRLLIWAVLTVFCTLPISRGNASAIRPRCCTWARASRCRSFATTKKTSVFLWA
jgi:hypothetical protein